MADLFGQWRLKKLNIQVIAREFTYVHLGVLVNEYHAAAPTTVEELQDLPYYMEGSGIFGAPLPSVSVTNADVKKLVQLKWYNTNTASAENEFEFFGNVYTYAPFATLNYDVLVTYTLEFGAPMDPSQAFSVSRDLDVLRIKRQNMRQGICSPLLSARMSSELKSGELDRVSSGSLQEDPGVLVRPTKKVEEPLERRQVSREVARGVQGPPKGTPRA